MKLFTFYNLFTGDRQNIIHMLKHPYFDIIRDDLTILFSIESDEICNLACSTSQSLYQFDAIQMVRTKIMGSINALGLAKQTKAKILKASTNEVSGDPIIHPQNEEYWGNVNPIGIRSYYDEGKRCSETLFMGYHR